jgi:hypothetical protein
VPAASPILDGVPTPAEPLFVYGSLTFDEVLAALLGRVPATVAAGLPAHEVRCVRGAAYPALVPAGAGRVADGLLLTDLTAGDWRILDSFEDDLYDLVGAVAVVAGGSRSGKDPVACRTYLTVHGRTHELGGPWDRAILEAAIDPFVDGCRRFMLAYRAGAYRPGRLGD